MKYNKSLLSLSTCLLLFFTCCSNDKLVDDSSVEIPEGMVLIPAQIHDKQEVLPAFFMDATEITNADFQKFVEATGYVTVAERPVDWELLAKELPPGTPKWADSLLAAGALVFTPTDQPVPLHDFSQWWTWTVGASWKHPQGPESSIDDIMDHPVVQIAWEDAVEYAKWAEKRLPTQAEWEWAAKGGVENAIYPWEGQNIDDNQPKANYWQGLFPYQNKETDGFYGTAPVASFAANGYGLFDMAGNVWEWCVEWASPGQRLIKGGSFLCNDDYCSGYRTDVDMASTPDTGLNHTGFRCVKDVE
ncbi:MAG: SUMF1/EgtB/PvdO family nonheme iron enzyme [Bacteroidota bacterium]